MTIKKSIKNILIPILLIFSLTSCTYSNLTLRPQNQDPALKTGHSQKAGTPDKKTSRTNRAFIHSHDTSHDISHDTLIKLQRKSPARHIEDGITTGSQYDHATSEKIDYALELCESAQQQWEKGNLDGALLELDAAYASILELNGDIEPELHQQKEDIRFMISKRILEIYASRHIVVKGQHHAIPITINSHVQKEIDRFTGPEKAFFLRSLERSGRYRPYIVAELQKAGLPEELSWLPLIESGFRVDALSPARALGL
ncbi:MAG: lytic transglycosylase, partial [Desulfamplus sp.]|nr:lytic transglycosylase [Desulfamplus sp.]